MPAPKGNQFWKLRLKHGRDRIIKSPEELWDNALEYFRWCDENPIIEIDFRGKNVERVELEKRRPYQKDAFALACDCSSWDVIEALKTVNEDFLAVVTRIERAITLQKYEGAAVGQFNPLIIARDLGLSDQQKHTFDGNVQIVIDKSEANA